MPHRQSALTLLELIITLAVAAVLAGIAVPSFNHTRLNAGRIASVNAFITATHLARSTAIRRNLPVVVCPGTEADPCAQPDDWTVGWFVFVNTDRDWPAEYDRDEPVLYRYTPPGRIDIAANRQSFRFHRVGLRSTNGTVTFCDQRGPAHARAVIVSYTGRPRVSRTRPDGTPIECP